MLKAIARKVKKLFSFNERKVERALLNVYRAYRSGGRDLDLFLIALDAILFSSNDKRVFDNAEDDTTIAMGHVAVTALENSRKTGKLSFSSAQKLAQQAADQQDIRAAALKVKNRVLKEVKV